MSDTNHPVVNQRQRLSASALRKLPIEERSAILEAQALLAEPIFRHDPRLTDFKAFREDDLHGESSSSEPV
jgi:hypothetical protein